MTSAYLRTDGIGPTYHELYELQLKVMFLHLVIPLF